jgi:hypothetical protein
VNGSGYKKARRRSSQKEEDIPEGNRAGITHKLSFIETNNFVIFVSLARHLPPSTGSSAADLFAERYLDAAGIEHRIVAS